MKKIFILFLYFIFFIGSSCNKNFLDKAPGVDVTEDDIFSSRSKLEPFVASLYAYAMPSMWMYEKQFTLSATKPINDFFWVIMYPSFTWCDEADESAYGYQAGTRWNMGNLAADNVIMTGDTKYYMRWISIRQINIMLKRIDEVPDATAAFKSQMKAEMHFLRALNYMEMVKRYGGVPIVEEIFEAGVKINKPRNTFEECVNFILKECDAAIANPDLPATQPGNQVGRATKTAAHALKAKVLLYAASPLFNTATPYLNSENNQLLCYGNFNSQRWQLAADAAKTALDFALANGYGLIDVPEHRDPQDEPGSGMPGPEGNYRNAWELNNNKEIILAYQGPALEYWQHPLNNFLPIVYWGAANSVSVPLNFFRKYEKKDGTPQNWDLGGGDDLLSKYAELDPRFKQTFNYTMSYFDNWFPVTELYNGGNHYADCKGGIWIRKYYPRDGHNANHVLNDPVFRVNELYLNYAEAVNEATGPTIEAYNAVNTIRRRSAMPNWPAGLSKEQFREKLKNERAVELAYDDQRFYDIRRWMIAEQDGVMSGNFYGLEINKNGDKFSWRPYVFETRTFSKKMYMMPFPLEEVQKGNLIQNPGYE